MTLTLAALQKCWARKMSMMRCAFSATTSTLGLDTTRGAKLGGVSRNFSRILRTQTETRGQRGGEEQRGLLE